MREITLTKDKVALVDDEDFEGLNQHKWYACFDNGTWYAKTSLPRPAIRGKKLRMHRLIMNPPDGMEVDHKDGNGLNNQKSNLRICTRSQNLANSKLHKNNSTGHRGVHFYKRDGNYQVYIQKDRVLHHLGYYDDPVEAALAYDKSAREMFGEFARTNFKENK